MDHRKVRLFLVRGEPLDESSFQRNLTFFLACGNSILFEKRNDPFLSWIICKSNNKCCFGNESVLFKEATGALSELSETPEPIQDSDGECLSLNLRMLALLHAFQEMLIISKRDALTMKCRTRESDTRWGMIEEFKQVSRRLNYSIGWRLRFPEVSFRVDDVGRGR